MSEPVPTLTLSELGRALVRGWRLLLGGVLTGIVAGTALHVALPQTYSATASVQIESTGFDPLAQTDSHPVDMATEAAIAASRGIAGSRVVEVHAAGESSVLQISHTSGTPRASAAGANAVARAYLADRSRRASEALRRLRATLAKQADALPADAPVAQVQPIAADLARARRLQVGGGMLIDAARPPERGNLPGLPIMCLAGAVLGLLGTMPLAARRTRPARSASQVVMLDIEPSATTELRQAASALADQVLVLRETDTSLQLAEQWCRHLRSVGIPAHVINASRPDS